MAQRPPRRDGSTPVTAEQVQNLTTQVLVEAFPLGLDGYRYRDADLFNVIVAAAAHRRSIESVCQQLVDAPSANWVRQTLHDELLDEVDVDAFEAACNAVLVAQLPPSVTARPVRLAIDLTLRPYYGTDGVLPDQLRRGEAKAGR